MARNGSRGGEGRTGPGRPAGRTLAGVGYPRGTRHVTMTDVARAAGCSQSTVSVVLNSTPGIQISEATRERVMEAAQRLGYPFAAPLPPLFEGLPPTGGTVGYLVDRLATAPEAVVSIEGARQEAWKARYMLQISQTLGDPEIEAAALGLFLQQNVDAVIYASIMTREVTLPQRLIDSGKPVVLLNCYTEDNRFPCVLPGETAGGQRAATALLQAGHSRVAMITGELWMDAARDRLTGYRRALATADIPFDPELVREGNWQTSAGYEHTHALMRLASPPTAIFCANDRMAVGCYEALKELGLHIPDDVSVVGYDDEEVSRHLSPPLTTLVLPHEDMGNWAVDRLFAGNIIEQPLHAPVKLECPLVERASIAPPRLAGAIKLKKR